MRLHRIPNDKPLPDYMLDEPERRQVYYDGTIVGEEDKEEDHESLVQH